MIGDTRIDAPHVSSGEVPDRLTPGNTTMPAQPRARLPYAVYDAVGTLLGLMIAPVVPFLLLTRHGRSLSERLGHLPPAARNLRRPIWIHAASVGEVLAAATLVDEIRRHWPDRHILLSTTSRTGRETARARLALDAVMLLPLDWGPIVHRVMRVLRPTCLVLVETEIWPALIRAAERQQVPCIMVSGRISARAAGRYARVRWLLEPVLRQISAFAMQSEADAGRIVALGAPADRVSVIGSLKYARVNGAASAAAGAAARAMTGDRPLLIAASTHTGEEQLVLEACERLWQAQPDLLLLIAPRRPERFDEVEQMLARAGVTAERRSRLDGTVARGTRVLLLDTLGELPTLLPAARGVFVGGTTVAVGGHNVLEPAAFGKPVAFGPHTENVAAAAEALLAHQAAIRVRNADELSAAWDALLREPAQAAAMGERGRAVVAERSAVARRTFDILHDWIGESA